MPEPSSRRFIHGGVGADGSMPRTTRVTNRSHPTLPPIGAASSTSTTNPSGVAAGGGVVRFSASPRSVKGAPVEWEYSRPTPR